jgi:tRNA-specific 2-thiouridylase
MPGEKIIVGMSGGVDSSVAALLLIEQGYTVEGLFMKNWEEDDDEDYCAAAVDLKDARSVCDKLGITLHTINFASEYWDRVFQHFLDEYRAGRTPNPDILCNKEIKFRAFLDYAISLGAHRIATGHYARTARLGDKTCLLRGFDSHKDQSYFLHALNQQQISHALFPIGEYQKAEIRQIAKDNGLATHNKKDSTGICFIGERRFTTFLEKYLPAHPGDIITTEGKVIGRHNGLMYYTLGQRKGIGVGGTKQSDEAPWYVVDKRMDTNQLVIAQGHDHPALHFDTLKTGEINWIAGTAPVKRCLTAKIRYRQPDQACEIVELSEKSATVVFESTQRAITPGQSIVFYDGDICLGGGIIETMYNQS